MKVLISIPNTGYIHKTVAMKLPALLSDRRHYCTLIMPTWKPYEHNMNRIAKDFVNGSWDFWLNIDSDNPPINNPLDLIDLDLDVVGLPTPVYNDSGDGVPIYWNAMDRDTERDGWLPHSNTHSLQEVDAVGTGCILISRRVLCSIKKPFIRTTDEDGIVEYGPDFNFCKRAKELGFRIWAHYDYPCLHFSEIDLVELSKRFGQLIENT